MSQIVALKRVTAYRTTDDQLHDNRRTASRHQAGIDLTAWIAAAAPGTNAEALASALIADAAEVIRLLRVATKDDEAVEEA